MSSDSPPPGRLVVISGPSGAGKSTVVRQLLERCPLPLKMSVSCTTRSARPGEIDGQSYWFLTDDEFHRRREAGDFLRYYAAEARPQFAAPTILPGPTGEENTLSLHGRGVFAKNEGGV